MLDMTSAPPALAAEGVTHRYGGVLALDGVSVQIGTGQFVSVLGSNGAGKSTLAMVLAGLLAPSSGTVRAGGHAVASRGHGGPIAGVSLVPEGRRLFGQLSVRENLLLGGFGAGASGRETRRRLDEVLASLPKALRDDPGRAAATLSGGEQQMLAIGRAIMAQPRTLIIDEPSMGLAPVLINQVYEWLSRLHADGVTILLMEQMATHAVRHSDMMVILDRGRVVYAGSPQGDAASAALISGYIGEEAL
ncbi:MAG: ABC transporter ATP-binding protein [Alphaproteobacteria bacterium]|nr:MAG: ABC transporter ATP-binding protein [Alphaproteobacteria bacterium]